MKRRPFLLLLAGTLIGCGEEGPKKYISVLTSGVSFDPSSTQANMLVLVRPVSPLPEGGKLVGEFKGTGLAKPEIVELPATFGQLLYKVELAVPTSGKNLFGTHVLLRALDIDGKELDRAELTLNSAIDPHELHRYTDALPDQHNGEGQIQFDHGTPGHG